MLAQTLDMVAKILPTTNEAFCLAQGIYLATASQDPKRAILIDSHFQRLLKPSKESTVQVLAAVAEFERQLNDDSLWEE
jgi:hypothetical protein